MCHFRPIFIVNTVPDSESDSDGKCGTQPGDESLADMEINNNNSLYLPGEDKGDNSDKFVQREKRVSQTVTTIATGFSRQKLVESSLKELIVIKAMEANAGEESINAHESSQSLNDLVTQATDDKNLDISEITAKQIDKDSTISDVSVGSEKCDESEQLNISTSKAPPIRERKSGMTQSKGESDVCSIIILFFDYFTWHPTMIGLDV